MKIFSNMFDYGQSIPVSYTCDGDNVNPVLFFDDIPEETVSLALIVDDLDGPQTPWCQWLVWNIPPYVRELLEWSKPGGVEGENSSGLHGYEGPCPKQGRHRYLFKLYALDTTLDLSSDANQRKLEQAMEGHVLSTAEYMGVYERPKSKGA